MKLIGKILVKMKFFAPMRVMLIRCWIVERIMATYAYTVEERAAVLNKANRFLDTMDAGDKRAVMHMIGLREVSWGNKFMTHTGDE